MKTFEVQRFVLGTPPHLTMETITVIAETQSEAEESAFDPLAGWGVYDSREVSDEEELEQE